MKQIKCSETTRKMPPASKSKAKRGLTKQQKTYAYIAGGVLFLAVVALAVWFLTRKSDDPKPKPPASTPPPGGNAPSAVRRLRVVPPGGGSIGVRSGEPVQHGDNFYIQMDTEDGPLWVSRVEGSRLRTTTERNTLFRTDGSGPVLNDTSFNIHIAGDNKLIMVTSAPNGRVSLFHVSDGPSTLFTAGGSSEIFYEQPIYIEVNRNGWLIYAGEEEDDVRTIGSRTHEKEEATIITLHKGRPGDPLPPGGLPSFEWDPPADTGNDWEPLQYRMRAFDGNAEGEEIGPSIVTENTYADWGDEWEVPEGSEYVYVTVTAFNQFGESPPSGVQVPFAAPSIHDLKWNVAYSELSGEVRSNLSGVDVDATLQVTDGYYAENPLSLFGDCVVEEEEGGEGGAYPFVCSFNSDNPAWPPPLLYGQSNVGATVEATNRRGTSSQQAPSHVEPGVAPGGVGGIRYE